MPIHQTLEQQRAQEALQCAKDAKCKIKEFKEYVNLVKKLPALISTNGLGQTLAFLAAKAKGKTDKEEGLLYFHLEQWLTREAKPRGPYAAQAEEEQREPMKLLYRICYGDSTTYRRATTEALAFITWLKSFADALQER